MAQTLGDTLGLAVKELIYRLAGKQKSYTCREPWENNELQCQPRVIRAWGLLRGDRVLMLVVRWEWISPPAFLSRNQGGNLLRDPLPALTLQRLVHTLQKQKPWTPVNLLNLLNMNRGFWEKIVAWVRGCSHQVMGILLDGKCFISVRLFAKSRLCAMLKTFEGNYLPDAILL